VAPFNGSVNCDFCPLHQWSNDGLSCSDCAENQACSFGSKIECSEYKYVTEAQQNGRLIQVCTKCVNDDDDLRCKGFQESLKSSDMINAQSTIAIVASILGICCLVLACILCVRKRKVTKLSELKDICVTKSVLFSSSNQNLPHTKKKSSAAASQENTPSPVRKNKQPQPADVAKNGSTEVKQEAKLEVIVEEEQHERHAAELEEQMSEIDIT
jgi:hypothetical protein